jgi:aspartyl-tRNA(Asn)/glutamyl-tRNA(Gln) amidotransferase subunit C
MTRIGLNPDEVERLTGDMEAILDHVGRLQEVATAGVAPDAHILGLRGVLRPDTVAPSLPVEDVLANAPEREGDFFVVPAVLGE